MKLINGSVIPDNFILTILISLCIAGIGIIAIKLFGFDEKRQEDLKEAEE